jgi:hypothetical protein
MKAFPNLKFFKLNSAFEDLKENFIRQTEQKIEEKRKKKLDKKLKKQK